MIIELIFAIITYIPVNLTLVMVRIHRCPIETAFYNTALGKKWTLTILRDLIFGAEKFSDFLHSNEDLSSKVLSERLKELVDEGLVDKQVHNTTPVETSYKLSSKGRDINKVLYELSIFGAKYYPNEVFGEDEVSYEKMVDIFGKGFKLPEEEIEFDKTPIVESTEISAD